MQPDRFAVLSDIHGNLPALQAVIADIRGQGVRQVLNLGDILSGPLWPAETASLLMTQFWPTIAGNHERQLLACAAGKAGGASDQFAAGQLDEAQLAWLRALPTSLQLGDVHLCHGSPLSDLQYLLEDIDGGQTRLASDDTIHARIGHLPDCSLLLCGHTHLARCVQLHDGPLVVNPGSVGLPAYADDTGGFHRIEAGSPHASYALLTRAHAGWQVELRRVVYDWESAALRASANGREDWAACLRSGRA